jgi:hypothetical protein
MTAARPFRLSCLRWLPLLLVTAGGGVLAFPAEQEKGPRFLVCRAEGKPVEGPVREIGKDWSVRLDGAGGQTVAGGDLLSLRQVGLDLPPLPEEAHLILVNGDRIPVEAPRLTDERLAFRHPDLADGKETQVPLSAVSVLWLEAPVHGEDAEQLRHRLIAEPRKRDRVLLLNGDVAEGVLNKLDGKKVEIEVAKKNVSIDVKQVAAIALSTELADGLKPRGVYARVVLTGPGRSNGGRLSLTAASSDGTMLTGTTLHGSSLRVPLARLAGLELHQGRAAYLADLKPARYDFFPYLDFRWPLVPNASVAGRDLRVGASTYARGLGLHAHSRVAYTLAGAYQRFQALAGLDPKTGQAGTARLNVLADGKALDLGPAELDERRPALTIDVGVAGVKELVLEVAFGKGGDVQGRVNVVEARLVK